MASLASKNLYDLLGNDPDQDPDREPEPPTKAIDKPVARSGKRGVEPTAPSGAAGAGASSGRRGGRGGAAGNEGAFHDRGAGSFNNRSNPPDGERHPDRIPRGDSRGRGRGRGRGGRGGAPRDDRHSHSGISDHPKQVSHGWGGTSGNDELADEKAGEAIAKEEEKGGFDTSIAPPANADGDTWAPDTSGGDGAAPGDEEPAEPETKSKSYEEYLAELAEKKLAIGSDKLAVRKPNEGADKKWNQGKAFTREEQDFFAGSGGKNSRVREKKEKQVVDMSGIDPRDYLAEDRQAGGDRGGRGRGRGRGDRGDRGDRGGDRGDRGDRGGRGDRGSDRGDFRGRGRGRGDRGDRGDSFRGTRGGRGGGSNPPRVDDSKAFPSLGS